MKSNDKVNNIGFICTTHQCDMGLSNKVAMHFITQDLTRQKYTYQDLDKQSNKFANILKNLSVKCGDRIAILLPKSPEQFIGFLGILKMQSVAVSLFSNLGEDAIMDRLFDSQAVALLTKRNLLKKFRARVDDLQNLKNIILIDAQEEQTSHVIDWQKEMASANDSFECQPTSLDAPSLIHYTSGSTGKPKGVLHAHQSIHLQRRTSQQILGLSADSLYWCTADQGWVTGTSYGIIGPWSLGVTQVHYAGAYDAHKWFKLLEENKISNWYTAPTALRMLMREDEESLSTYDLSNLKHISSVGEPLNPEIIQWAKRLFNKDIYDTWFQTETGAIMIANRPGLPIKVGSMGKPVDGIEAAVILESKQPAIAGESGNLCLRRGWDSMFVDYINNTDVYMSKFRDEYYYSGDNAYRDEDGYYWFQGRNDDIINTAGHLVSPFEIESALLELPEVAESAAVAIPDELLFEKVVVFVNLKSKISDLEALEMKMRLHISQRVSSVATPQDVCFIENIPKNKSGKILRRILKAKYLGLSLGDTSTMENEHENL